MKNSINNGKLVLINEDYGLELSDFEMKLEKIKNTEIGLEKDCLKNLYKALEAVDAFDEIVPVSGYRPRKEQEEIYNNCLKENGQEFAKKYVALPGHSEHESGLAIDLGLKMDEIDFIRPYFPYEGICQDFRLISVDYGFIERYTAEKENITKISHEPWHFRYVGYPHSRIIFENKLCLEEYIDFLKAYSKENPLSFIEYRIFYSKDFVEDVYNISGNNIDGYIVTERNIKRV